jgi:hypothetical protein
MESGGKALRTRPQKESAYAAEADGCAVAAKTRS